MGEWRTLEDREDSELCIIGCAEEEERDVVVVGGLGLLEGTEVGEEEVKRREEKRGEERKKREKKSGMRLILLWLQ